MHHDTPLISTIVAGLVLAYLFGMIANRLKMPPLVGYLIAGIFVGPYTPGFVADQELGAELAELGVILLMFGVGLHFSLKDLLSVRAIAIPGAVVQIACATLLGAGLGLLMGWDLPGSLLFGLALSTASTVVLLKAMQDRRLIETERGRIAVGWLIVEDLAMVLALVLVPAVASLNGTNVGGHDPFVSFVTQLLGMDVGIWGILALTIVKVVAFMGFMMVVGRRVIPWALHATAHTGSRELFRLAVLAIALGVALGSAMLFGVSLALGAFFAGMILAESELSHRAANETLPLRDAFAVLFFVSVGMLFDPMTIINDPLPLLATVFIIMIGKSLAAFGIVLLFGRPVSTALTISASLAQIGEFSFILASMGVALALMPAEGQSLILAGALISIVLNPVSFWLVDLAKPYLEAKVAHRKGVQVEPVIVDPVEPVMAAKGPATTDAPSEPAVDRGGHGADDDTAEPSQQTGHTVLVGFGQVGRIVAAGIKEDGGKLVVIEDSDHDIAAARAEGFEVVFGNAASSAVLKLANLSQARTLLVAISNGFEAGSVCESGRKLNPSIAIIARAYSEEEEGFLRNLGATTVIRGEREIGKGILTFLRSDRPDSVLSAQEPKLPDAENILAKAAAGTVVADAVVSQPSGEDATAEAEGDPIAVNSSAAEFEHIPVEAEQLSSEAEMLPAKTDAAPAAEDVPVEIDEIVAAPSVAAPEVALEATSVEVVTAEPEPVAVVDAVLSEDAEVVIETPDEPEVEVPPAVVEAILDVPVEDETIADIDETAPEPETDGDVDSGAEKKSSVPPVDPEPKP